MVRIGSTQFAICNLLTMVYAIFVFIMFGRMFSQEVGMCEKWRAEPFYVFGLILLGLSLLGMAGGCFQNSRLVSIYLFIFSLFIILVMIFISFTFTITHKVAGKEYKLVDYSPWLQRRESNWHTVNNCLQSIELCSGYGADSSQHSRDVVQIQSGCCKPPSDCNFVYQSPIVWNKPMTTGGNYSRNSPDCGAWDNDPNVLCFNCNSCKAELLKNMKGIWWFYVGFFLAHLIGFIIFYAIGIRAFRNIGREESLNLNGVDHLVI